MDSASKTFLYGLKRFSIAAVGFSAVYFMPYGFKKLPDILNWWENRNKIEEKPVVLHEPPKPEPVKPPEPEPIFKPIEQSAKLKEAIANSIAIRKNHAILVPDSNGTLTLSGWRQYQTFANDIIDYSKQGRRLDLSERLKSLDRASASALVDFIHTGKVKEKGETFYVMEVILINLAWKSIGYKYNESIYKECIPQYHEYTDGTDLSKIRLNTLVGAQEARAVFDAMLEANAEYNKKNGNAGSIDPSNGQFIPKAKVVEETPPVQARPSYQSREREVLRALAVEDEPQAPIYRDR